MKTIVLLVLCACIITTAGSIAAQSDDARTYHVGDAWISVPGSWEVVSRDGAFGASEGAIAVYAYAPSLFPEDTVGDTPSEILVSVFEHFNANGYLLNDPLTVEVNGRTLAYTDYSMFRSLRGQMDSVYVRFMIVPFADGRYGALTLLVDAGSPDLLWTIFEPIIVSFDSAAPLTLTPYPLVDGYVIGIPQDNMFMPLGDGTFVVTVDEPFTTIQIFPPAWLRSDSDPSVPMDCEDIFVDLATGMFDPTSDTKTVDLLMEDVQHSELPDGRAVIWRNFLGRDSEVYGRRLVVLTVAEGECAAMIFSTLDNAIDMREALIDAMLASFVYSVQPREST